MEKLAALNGEVVTIAVDPARGRVVACTSDCNAAVLEHDEPSEDSASLVRSALEGMKADWSPDLHAAFIAGRLYLTFGSFELKGGGHSALLVVDLDAGTTAEVHRDADGFYTGRVSPPVGVDDRFVLVETFDGEASKLVAFELPGLKRRDVLRLEIQDAELGLVRPVVAAMALVPAGRRLYLVTTDPDNCDGNRLLHVDLDADCLPLGPPETLVREKWEPYSPCIGGACANPATGEAACLMYASEWEKFVPIARLPEQGDSLPAADLHLARPGVAPRRLDVLGYLGTNVAFYDREADAPNLPQRFRIRFDFAEAGAEVTPLIALGPDRYLVALFRGTL